MPNLHKKLVKPLVAALLLLASALFALPVYASNPFFASSSANQGQPVAPIQRSFRNTLPKEASVTDLGPLRGHVIGIDPGHQEQPDFGLEPIAPGSTATKHRMSQGAVGAKSGASEHSINLQIAAKLAMLLRDSGASVVLTRTESGVSLSNAERAQLMNNAGVELWIRLHCDASSSLSASGAYVLIPSHLSSPDISGQSLRLADCVLGAFCASTGAAARGVRSVWNQTGFNWSVSPVITLEMGYLSNPQDDLRLCSESYQQLCAHGIYNGLLEYFFIVPGNPQ